LAELLAAVPARKVPSVSSLEAIYERYSAPDKGGDKGTLHSYIPVYASEIQPDVTSLLEIGVYEGHSLAMWQEYLPNATVIGFDIDISPVKFEVDARQVDATNCEQVRRAVDDMTFDVIIDDGSHRVYDQIASFALLFEKLAEGGIYAIEDVQGPDALRVLTECIEKHSQTYWVSDLRGTITVLVWKDYFETV